VPPLESAGGILGLITLVAAVVNGALGYGFSSITVPLALLFLTSRVLNPALVLVEMGITSTSWSSTGTLFRRPSAASGSSSSRSSPVSSRGVSFYRR